MPVDSRPQGPSRSPRPAAASPQPLFNGGAVRDRLLGRERKDHDGATSALPEEVEALFPRSVTVGARFGVVVVPVPAGDAGGVVNVEVAAFRADGRYVDGRRPEG